MEKRKISLLIILVLLLGGVAGYIINSMIISRYNIINATCSLLNAAVDDHMLSSEQIFNLGRLTKKKLGDSQTAKAFRLSEEQVKSASESSNCSQFMVGMNQP